MSDLVRDQYERFPYPPAPWMALPRRGQGEALRLENAGIDHAGKRILVAGAGTLEGLVAAEMHPRAREIVAVDLSESSLQAMRKRIILRRVARPFSRKLPPIRA